MSSSNDAEAASRTWLTRAQLAERWQIPEATLRDWATDRKGPRFAKFGRHVRYRLSDIIDWENQRFKDPD